MAFNASTATPQQLEARLIRFQQKQSQMKPEHFKRVLASFPEEIHTDVIAAVKENGPTTIFRQPGPPQVSDPVKEIAVAIAAVGSKLEKAIEANKPEVRETPVEPITP